MNRRTFLNVAITSPFLKFLPKKKLTISYMHPLQKRFFESEENLVMFGGGYGNSKLYGIPYHHSDMYTSGTWLGISRSR